MPSAVTRIRRYKVPRSVTVEIDTREKIPIPFPQVVTYYPEDHPERGLARVAISRRRVKLDAGDYKLAGYTGRDGRSLCIVERKKSLAEITTNLLTDDRPRAESALKRLSQATPHPYLLIEQPLSQALRPSAEVPNPDLSLDALYRVLARYNVHLLWLGSSGQARSRKRVGEQIIRIFFSHILSSTPISSYDDSEYGESPPVQVRRQKTICQSANFGVR